MFFCKNVVAYKYRNYLRFNQLIKQGRLKIKYDSKYHITIVQVYQIDHNVCNGICIGVLCHFQQYFSYIMAVSFIG